MRLSFQIILAIALGLVTIYAGMINFYDPSLMLASAFQVDIAEFSNGAQLAITTQIRFLSAMWVIAGIFILLSVRHFETQTSLIRLVLLGNCLGVIGELITVYDLGGELKASVFKCFIAIIICTALEAWRLYLVKKSVEGEQPPNLKTV